MIAIAKGLGSDEIAAGALLMGAIFLVAGRVGLLDLAARAFPRALVRGVQLTVGLLGDLRGARDWALALVVGGLGFAVNLGWALGIGLVLWWIPLGIYRLRARTAQAPA